MKPLVFVYGTLKRGGRLHGLMEPHNFVGNGVVYGYGMRAVGSAFPGMTPHPKKWVYGEVYRITRSVTKSLAALDRAEGVNFDLYRRIQVPVRIDRTAEHVLAFSYEWVGGDDRLVGPWLHTWSL